MLLVLFRLEQNAQALSIPECMHGLQMHSNGLRETCIKDIHVDDCSNALQIFMYFLLYVVTKQDKRINTE